MSFVITITKKDLLNIEREEKEKVKFYMGLLTGRVKMQEVYRVR